MKQSNQFVVMFLLPVLAVAVYMTTFVPVIGEDGNVEAIAGSTRDVTERKHAEEMAKRAESRRRLALEASHSFGIWDWDIKQNLFAADERLGELFNLSSDEAENGVAIEVPKQYIHPDDLAACEAAICESINNRTPFDEEYVSYKKTALSAGLHLEDESFITALASRSVFRE